MRPVGPLLTFVILAAVTGPLIWSSVSQLSRDFSGDEAAKVAETYFLRLAIQRDLQDPLWTDGPIHTTNPFFAKAVFGAALLVGPGTIPARPYLQYSEVERRWQADPCELENYRSSLLTLRLLSLLCMLGTAVLLFRGVEQRSGWMAAAFVVGLLSWHYLSRTLAATAIVDSLQGLFLTTCLYLTMEAARSTSKVGRSARFIAAAIAVGLASQVRLNGILFLLPLMISVLLASEKKVQGALVASALGLVSVSVATLTNPYYWAGGPGASLLGSVVARYRQQLSDVNKILNELPDEVKVDSPLRGLVFIGETVVSGKAGWILGLLFVVASLIAFRSLRRVAFSASWCASAIFLVAGWLPLFWDKYVFLLLPSLIYFVGVQAGVVLDKMKIHGDTEREYAALDF